MRLTRRLLVCTAACVMGSSGALAHDSWLVPSAGGGWELATGRRYPLADAGSVAVQPACRSRGGARSCWTSLADQVITIEPKLVDEYLREIRPPRELVDAWAAQKEAGIAWRETYRKFARVETGVAGDAAELRSLREPAGLPLEIVIDGDAPVKAGEASTFRVLSAGEPVQGLSVELVSERSPLGVWLRSDARGRLQSQIPFAGAWLLRATLLERDGTAWRSRFVTLAFWAQQRWGN